MSDLVRRLGSGLRIFLVFGITPRILRNVMEHIDSICSLESGLYFGSICSIRLLSILEVIAKCLTLIRLIRSTFWRVSICVFGVCHRTGKRNWWTQHGSVLLIGDECIRSLETSVACNLPRRPSQCGPVEWTTADSLLSNEVTHGINDTLTN